MYNILKNKIYAYFYYNFVKQFFNKVSQINNEEEVYYRNNKLIVLVKNSEVGERIYSIIKTLKDRNETISTHNMTFRIDNYIIDKHNRVESFFVDCNLKREWTQFTKIEKLQELASLVSCLKSKGYVLDNSKFESAKCNSISSFLSFVILDEGKEDNKNGCIINYIHYVLSEGGNLEEFYERIVTNNLVCEIEEFPYSLPIITMCYNYFVEGSVPDNICDVLQNEKDNDDYYNCYSKALITSKKSLASTLRKIEENDEYTIYEGNIKVYHHMSSEFEEFFKDEDKVFINNEETIEKIESIIIDFRGNIIGYKFSKKEFFKDADTIFNKKLSTQCSIIRLMIVIYSYIFEVRSSLYYFEESENDFNIEQSLVLIGNGNTTCKITNIKQVFNLVTSNEFVLRKQLLTIFFKLYMIYLGNIYGKMNSEEQFLEKMEVRYLSPVLTKAFINYALKKEVDYEVAIEEFRKFLYCTSTYANEQLVYDSRFENNPLEMPFIFDYEVERKYGIKIKKNMNQSLPDGRKLITFNRSKKISKVKDSISALRKNILEKLGDIEGENVKISDISEIIYSKNINKNNMYNVEGYILEQLKGKQITDEVLLSLSNKDFFKVAEHLFSKFGNYYIPLENIWMDDNFIFYINILDDNFKIKKCPEVKSNISDNPFFNWIVQYLLEKGYNPNAFIDFQIPTYYYFHKYCRLLANRLDTYCTEHDIYYSSQRGCPICKKSKYFLEQNFEEYAIKLFEDIYAVHYRIGSNYNLKVYKSSSVDMVELEKNIDSIITRRLNSKESQLRQDCFVPYLKAINHNNHFIGYVYSSVDFYKRTDDMNVCNDIQDAKKVQNLPRLMSIIRLILQIKEITNEELGFIKDPFSHVFLSKSHKKQVQVLNIEFLSKKGSIKDTMKWTCKYVSRVLNADSSIEVDISDCSMKLDAILEKLQLLAKDMTRYCSIHKMYYRTNYLFCPKCINKKEMKYIEVEEVKKANITKQKLENEGGESYIYYYDDNSVAKVFKEEINYDLKIMVMACILAKKETLKELSKKNQKCKFIIPQKLLLDSKLNKIFGYTMSEVKGVPLSSLRDKEEVKRLGLSKQDVFEILIEVGKGIETLHDNNIYIGDLNGRNILFDTEKNIYFLDFDGMGVDNIAPEFCTDGYIDPISKKNQNITQKDDWYSFAIQAFYYLTFTHPFNGIYKENGKILDIPDKMERRISLLGNHGMEPPKIAEPWTWMDKELEMVFFNIFEGESRESIVPYLVTQYENLYTKVLKDNSIRINPKFVATEVNPFKRDVVHIINHYSAVCKTEDRYYLSILGKNNNEKIIDFTDWMDMRDIQNVLLTENEKVGIVIHKNKVIAINLETKSQIYTKEILNFQNVVVNGNTLYFTGTSKEGNVIFQIDFASNNDVKEQNIKFLVNQETKSFFAKFNSKFILVKRSEDNTVDQIYCNSKNLCDLTYNYENTKYNIIYDDISDSWLVISSQGKGIIIKGNGTFKTFDIKESINDINVENLSFHNGIIYIPNQNSLHIVNTNDQTTTKKMECHEIMTPNSRLYNICADGFSVLNNNTLYEIRRG